MMIRSIRYITILIIALSSVSAKGQSGYNIDITINGAETSFLTIGYHLGNNQYIKDTITTDLNGRGVYSGSEPLDPGLYIILLPDNRYFDIIVDRDQNFEIRCSVDDIVGTMQVSGSKDNQDFIEYQRKWILMQGTARRLRERLQNNASNADSTSLLRTQLTEYESKMIGFLRSTSESSPGSFLSLLVKALLPISVPEFNLPSNSSNPDSLRWIMGYNYNKEHFFDNVDLSDSRIIRTPILHGKLETYFSNVLIQHPDTLIRNIPRVVEMTRGDSAMFRYITVYLFNHFRESTIMGHDGVTVKIIDDYYLSGRANWISEETFNSLSEDAARLRSNLIGVKSVNLVMETYSGIPQALHDVRKEYTIVYFWEPNCGHCKTSTPLLKEYYDRVKDTDIEIYAVCTQGSREEWESYIAENNLDWINAWDPDRTTHFDFYYNVNSTPMIYILDRNKVIIAKKLSVENIEGFINNFRKSVR